jgi:hypothetical protein
MGRLLWEWTKEFRDGNAALASEKLRKKYDPKSEDEKNVHRKQAR